jgi:2-methylcitrate dehydratase PrpD
MYMNYLPKSGVTENLSRNIVKLEYGDMPSKIIELTKSIFLDALGCMLAGALQGSSRKVLRYVRSQGGFPESTVAVYGDRTNAYYAALVNGAFGHGWGFDDAMGPGLSCESILVPATLAIAEKELANGHEVITAVATGWEVISRLAAAASNIPARRPLAPISTFGPFGAAAVAGKMLNFNEFDMENAISLCTGQAAANLRSTQTGGEAARLHAGFAAMYGLRAAHLARLGLSGAREILEGRQGYFMCVSGLRNDGDPIFNVSRVNEGFGKEWYLERVTFKKYPVENGQLGVIEAVERLRDTYKIGAEDVEEIVIDSDLRTGGWMTSTITVPRDNDIFGAQHSTAWSVAMTMVLKRNDITAYRLNTPPGGRSAAIARFVKKIKIVDDAEVNKKGPYFKTVTIKLKNGKVVDGAGDWPRGNYLHNPMTDAELQAKFREQATRAGIAEAKQDRIIELVAHLEDQDDVRALMACLVRGA